MKKFIQSNIVVNHSHRITLSLAISKFNYKYLVNNTIRKYNTLKYRDETTLGKILNKIDLVVDKDNTQKTQEIIENTLYNDYKHIFDLSDQKPVIIDGVNSDLLGKALYDYIEARRPYLEKYTHILVDDNNGVIGLQKIIISYFSFFLKISKCQFYIFSFF